MKYKEFLKGTGVALIAIVFIYLLMYGTKALAISDFDGFAYVDAKLNTQGLSYEIDYNGGSQTYRVFFSYWHDDEIVYYKSEYVDLEEIEETIRRHTKHYFEVKENMNRLKSIE